MNATNTPAIYPADAPYVVTDVKRGYSEDSWSANDFGNVEFRMYSRYVRHVCNFLPYTIGPKGEGRQVTEGPMVPGPWGFMTALATVISAEPGKPVQRIDVQAGDHIQMAGHVWKITDNARWDYPKLEWVREAAETRAELTARREVLVQKANGLHKAQLDWDAEYRREDLAALYREISDLNQAIKAAD